MDNQRKSSEERMDLWSKGRDKAIVKMFMEYCYDKFSENPRDIMHMVPASDKDDFEKYVLKRNNNRYKYLLITINYKPDVDIKEIVKKTEKVTKKKWINKAMWCYEQREKDEKLEGLLDGEKLPLPYIFKGIHVHMKVWLSEKKNPYHCKREVFNTVKHIVGNKMHVNVRYSNRDGCFDAYCNGWKNESHKPGWEMDCLMRKRLGLEYVYTTEK